MTTTADLKAGVLDTLEAKTRRLMAERALIPNWGNGRQQRRDKVAEIDAALDQWQDARR